MTALGFGSSIASDEAGGVAAARPLAARGHDPSKT